MEQLQLRSRDHDLKLANLKMKEIKNLLTILEQQNAPPKVFLTTEGSSPSIKIMKSKGIEKLNEQRLALHSN